MKRLFFLVPDLDETANIVHELSGLGVNQKHIHICGGLPEDLEEAHLNRAGVFYTSHLGSAIKKGPFVGLLFALFIFTLFSIVLPPNIHINAFGFIAMLLIGVVIGVWATGLIGIGVKDEVVEKYEKYVEEGHFIMMVDTPDGREQEVTQAVLSHHPAAKMAMEATAH